MKLLYATSLTYPSRLANRAQVFSMAEAFDQILHDSFILGVLSFSKREHTSFIHEIHGSAKSPLLAFRYIKLIRTERITHVYCREDKLSVFLMLYARLMRLRPIFVFEAHYVQRTMFFRAALRWADGVVATTEAAKRDICALTLIPPDRVLLARNGVDLSDFSSLPAKEDARRACGLPVRGSIAAYVGSFGFYHSWKGIDIFLEAARYTPEILFVAVGGREEEVVEFSKRFPDPNIKIYASVEQHEVPVFLAAADLVVLPNRSGERESERYTSPLKLFQYMASGTPIVASDLPSVREIISEEDALLFKPDDPRSLAETLKSALADPADSDRRAAHARMLVTQYTFPLRAKAVIGFLASL